MDQRKTISLDRAAFTQGVHDLVTLKPLRVAFNDLARTVEKIIRPASKSDISPKR